MNACSSRERVGVGRFCISSAITATGARAGGAGLAGAV
jgi:hypothetical protein